MDANGYQFQIPFSLKNEGDFAISDKDTILYFYYLDSETKNGEGLFNGKLSVKKSIAKNDTTHFYLDIFLPK